MWIHSYKPSLQMADVAEMVTEVVEDYMFVVEECGIDEADMDLSYKLLDARLDQAGADRFFSSLNRAVAAESRSRGRIHLAFNGLDRIPAPLSSSNGLLSMANAILLHGNELTQLGVEWLHAAPAAMELNAVENAQLETVTLEFLLAAVAQCRKFGKGFKLKLHGCDALVAPPYELTGCNSKHDAADLEAMIQWHKAQGQVPNHAAPVSLSIVYRLILERLALRSVHQAACQYEMELVVSQPWTSNCRKHPKRRCKRWLAVTPNWI